MPAVNFLLIQGLMTILGLIGLVCIILVWVKMFQNEKTGLGIACIILTLCAGIGGLITFIYGWIMSGEWKIKSVMLFWTISIILQILLFIVFFAQFMAYIKDMGIPLTPTT
jgi:hypothetical protein